MFLPFFSFSFVFVALLFDNNEFTLSQITRVTDFLPNFDMFPLLLVGVSISILFAVFGKSASLSDSFFFRCSILKVQHTVYMHPIE